MALKLSKVKKYSTKNYVTQIKKGRVAFPTYRVKPETIESLKQTAIDVGYTYGDGAAMGELLDRLAEIDKELLKAIIKKP